jgi:hypothetical protein
MLRASIILPAILCGTLLGSGAALAASGDLDTVQPALFMDMPGATESVSRVTFTSAVVESLYAQENSSACFQNLSPSAYTKLFGDVTLASPYAHDLCIAIHAGLINGNRDANFRPDAPVTVAEASKILAKAYGLVYPSLQPSNAPWYWAYTQALRERGALDADRRASAILTGADMKRMFDTLESTERYPAHREVGAAPVAAAPVRYVALPTNDKAAERLLKRIESRRAAGDRIVVENAADPETIVRTRHAARISRRQLLIQVTSAK